MLNEIASKLFMQNEIVSHEAVSYGHFLVYLYIICHTFSGISRDSWHKRRATGGKKKPLTKKRKHCLGRPPANTRVSFSLLNLVFFQVVAGLLKSVCNNRSAICFLNVLAKVKAL